MKIQESTVSLAATHEASSQRSREVHSEIGFRELFQSLAEAPPETPETRQQALRERVQRLLESLLASILAAMDGKPCRGKIAVGEPAAEGDPGAGQAAQGGGRLREFTWLSRSVERISEKESSSVCGQGVVRTCDGREIAFDFKVSAQREFNREVLSEEGGTVQLRDPLVLNFDGKYCELVNERFAFDLDVDGQPEYLPGLAGGNGFLVFDRNGNGRADDGSELFGASSGDGFADLARLDDDGNGWIDEGDAAFSRLALWSGEQWQSLTARGVGALYSSAVDAPFALKTADNELLGQIRAAGVYLLENGRAGLMQQVDLASSALPVGQQEPQQGQPLTT